MHVLQQWHMGIGFDEQYAVCTVSPLGTALTMKNLNPVGMFSARS